jgi:hypothetical protein
LLVKTDGYIFIACDKNNCSGNGTFTDDGSNAFLSEAKSYSYD